MGNDYYSGSRWDGGQSVTDRTNGNTDTQCVVMSEGEVSAGPTSTRLGAGGGKGVGKAFVGFVVGLIVLIWTTVPNGM